MRVLSLVNDVTALGGVEAFQHDLATELPRLGVEFRVLNLRPSGGTKRDLPSWAFDYKRSRWLRGPLLRLHVRRAVLRFSADIHLVHQPSALSFLIDTIPAAGARVVSVVHNNSTREQYWRTELRWQQRINGYVAVSTTIQNRLVNEFGLRDGRVWTIPCGINTAKDYLSNRPRPPKKAGHLNLLYVGRLASYAKNVLHLVDLVRALNESSWRKSLSISLHVVGEGPDGERLKDELQRAAGRVTINWHGRISRDAVFQLCEKTHCVLLFSSTEGMPIALREAMSRGAVPVVTDIPAHREIITDGKNGFLFPLGELDACASVLLAAANSDDFEQVSRNAAASIEGHSVKVTAAKYTQLFAAILQKQVSATESSTSESVIRPFASRVRGSY